MLHDIFNALEETLFMVFSAGLLTWVLGLPLGTALAITGPRKFLANPLVHQSLKILVHTTRSVPYIILMIALIPLTRFLTGSTEGTVASIIPLTLAATPYFALLCENAIYQIPAGLTETAYSMGASNFQMITKILLPEALPNIISGFTVVLVHLIGYSTIAGALGGGGLGELAFYKGYQVFHWEYILATVLIMITLVKMVQRCGDYIANGAGNTNRHTSL